MIDIETIVFDAVYQEIGSLLPPGCLVSEYVHSASKFPFVSLVEIANVTYRRGQDNRLDENFAIIAYDANIFAQTKEECRRVAGLLDAAMLKLQFTRISPGMQFIQNMNLSTTNPFVIRMHARYEAITDGKEIYRKN